jgi:hypothetical protein
MRALKSAYLSNVEGSVIIDFQFSPSELDFSENSSVKVETLTGEYGADLFWTSSNMDSVTLKLFIDRTSESFVGTKTPDKEKTVKIPSWFPKPYETSAIVNAIKRQLKPKEAGQIERSSYDPSPNFKQDEAKYNGVLTDLAKIQLFLRPEGYKSSLSGMLVNSKNYKGKLNIEESAGKRFSPPPIIRFFHGDLWVEGYATKFSYNLSVMNTQLVPQRLTGDLIIVVSRSGQFKSVGSSAENYSSNNKVYMS